MYGIGYDEPKFKVGDRVRVVKNGYGDCDGSCHGASVGEEDTIIADADEYGRIEGEKWFYSPDEIELVEARAPAPKFKVGQRVHSLKVPEAGVGYVQGYSDTGACIVHYKDTWFRTCHERESEISPAFFPGDKVRVTKHSGYFAIGDVGEVEIQKDATVFVKHDYYSRVGLPIDADALELVEAAVDEPKQKFKAGDANLGVITSGIITDGIVTISTRPCIVARVVDGTPRPSNVPYVHPNAASATTEAERLARNNPGQEFAVYQRVAGRIAEVSYSMKEVA